MAAADDKKFTAHFDTGVTTATAVLSGAPKNMIAQVAWNRPGEAIEKHNSYWFIGNTVPNNTDYPDSIAPIGSMYTYLAGTTSITGSNLYIKTAAGTWTAVI